MVQARSISWMLGGALPVERLDLAPVNGATVSLRAVSAEDQARWREKRRSRMTGYGALGDEGDVLARSYPFMPTPEWLLDCCTVCLEVSRSAELPAMPPDDEIHVAAVTAAGATELDLASTSGVDLLRLLPLSTPIQVPVTELVVVTTDGHYSRNERGWSTPGFRWQFVQQRWELSTADLEQVAAWWQSLMTGPNREALWWPLRRFGVAQQRPFVEDRLVDLVVALEAMFGLESDRIKGTGGRMAARANGLLDGDRPTARLRTKRIVDTYTTRNEIVHGRLPPEDEIEGAAAAMEVVIADSLRGVLAATTRFDPAAPGVQRQTGR